MERYGIVSLVSLGVTFVEKDCPARVRVKPLNMPSCRVLGWINFHLKSLTISARILTSKYQLFEAGVSSDGSSNYRTVFSNLSYNEVSSAVKWKVLGFVIQA